MYGKLTVKLLSVKTCGDIVVRRLEVVGGGGQLSEPRVVTLLQLTSWPMKGLPHPTAILSLIDHLTNAQMRSSSRRTVIMCRSEMQYKSINYYDNLSLLIIAVMVWVVLVLSS